jgi:Zn-dependent membrane protease YugP
MSIVHIIAVLYRLVKKKINRNAIELPLNIYYTIVKHPAKESYAMYFDWTYVYMVLPFVLFAMIASARVNSAFKKYSGQLSSRNISGAEAAQRVLYANGVQGVTIERVSGSLTDHYDPRGNVIRLSQNVYDSTSVAAIGVACHEAGHAVQYAQNYAPIKMRAAIIPATNIGSKLAIPLVLIGLFFTSLGQQFIYIAYAGIGCFAVCALFQIITLPVEFNASHRAISCIETGGILTDNEQKGARAVLRAAAMTYVAALAVSLAQLLRLFLLVSGRGRR